MRAKLYWFAASHPAMAARKMLELKGVEFDVVSVLPGMQRLHLRAAGFRGGTVPALKLDGRRVQGSREIARALDARTPEPALFPSEPAARARVEEAELWGERELQSVPRVLIRWGLVRDLSLRRWLAEGSGMPLPGLAGRASAPVAAYYARAIGADESAARRLLAALPAMLARCDALLEQRTLRVDAPNAATLQILSSVRALDAFADLHEHVAAHPSAAAARSLFPDFPGPVPAFLPRAWLRALGEGAAG
ncbi:MAG TPA: glutathione S-transferase N-terminal domain-containing protein [Solirubrobacteraceae bacterium]|nr:glutathione S-transferase N-terminal domain-containing protein [Solirubrobacteraceae bacterium]